MTNRFAFAALVSLAFAAPATANVITFNATPQGGQAEGFVATGEPGISWTSANGTGLVVGAFFESNGSPALAAFSDTDGNFIIGTLSSAISAISMEFGNDDPAFTNPGDFAVLRVYNGVSLVGLTAVVLNRDDIMNQTISFSGSSFTSFSFAYTNSSFSPYTGGGLRNTGLIEIIDNVTFDAVVPEPASWGLMVAGFGMMGAAMRRRKVALAA